MAPMSESRLKQIRAESRRKILGASLNLFASRGVDRTSMADIAKKAKVSKGLLYNYFKSKDDIFKTLIIDGLERFFSSYNVFSHHSEDPVEQLRNGLREAFKLVRADVEYFKLLVALSTHAADYAKLMAIGRRYQRIMDRSLERILARMGSKDPKRDVFMFNVYSDGLMYGFLQSPETFPIERTVDQFIDDITLLVRR